MKQNILIAALLAGMLALAGCGGGSSSAPATKVVEGKTEDGNDGDQTGMTDTRPKSVAVAGLTDEELAAGKSETIKVEAGTPRDVGTKTYTCPEGTCEITFTNVLGTITAMATGGVTVADKANPQLPPADGVPRSNDKLKFVYGKYGMTNPVDGWHFQVKDGNTNALKSHGVTVVANNWLTDNMYYSNDVDSKSSFNIYVGHARASDAFGPILGRQEIKSDAAYMILGAWAVAQPGSSNLKAGKHYHSSKALSDVAKGRLDARLGDSDGGKATYNGQAVGVTVTGSASPFKTTYEAWTDGAVRLMADFEKMELKGWVKKGSDVLMANNSNADVTLKKASIASYAASGDIESGGLNPTKTGSWNAEFTNDGSWVIGGFDTTPVSKQDTTYMRHYGTFGATCSAAACNQQ